MNSSQIIVIGGGAAGLMAAGRAAMGGHKVILLEKMPRTGLKIGISGKGRCNLTNILPLEEFLTHFGPNGRFLRQCFYQFFSGELQEFFEARGLRLVCERGGRIFPASGRALDVVRTLNDWLTGLSVTILKNQRVTEIRTENGRVSGVSTEKKSIDCRMVILATGGSSYPRTGSTGDGYALAMALGHTVIPPRPALVPLTSTDPCVARLEGLELRNVTARLFIEGKKSAQEFGEILFREGTVAGATILSLSSSAVNALAGGNSVRLVIDLKSALDEKKLDARLQRDLQKRAGEPLTDILRGLLPSQLIPICLEQCKLDAELDTRNFSRQQRKRLAHWLKNFSIEINGHRGWQEAIVTAGGISLKEVDPRTMESKLVKGLYPVGELLDLQADTGGYNLQAAFSTGWLAGSTADI